MLSLSLLLLVVVLVVLVVSVSCLTVAAAVARGGGGGGCCGGGPQMAAGGVAVRVPKFWPTVWPELWRDQPPGGIPNVAMPERKWGGALDRLPEPYGLARARAVVGTEDGSAAVLVMCCITDT